MRRAKSLRIGVHIADGVVWGPVYRTRLRNSFASCARNLAGVVTSSSQYVRITHGTSRHSCARGG